ncbi:hypothetical protein [Rhodococcus sp. 077-4]|uniref:hypothetical protein n=1 Tax=Rhodococcus sp. 077-4 TaxID=2789271 RepID=UPI0039F61735
MTHTADHRLLGWTRIAGVVFVMYTVVMARYETIMHRAGGSGIIDFELAGSGDRAEAIIEAWGPAGVSAARTSLHLDFGYMTSYGLFLALLTEKARRRQKPGPPRRLSRILQLAPIIAVGCDAREGAELLAVLRGHDVDRHARRARVAALTKFMALFVGLTFWVTSGRRRA